MSVAAPRARRRPPIGRRRGAAPPGRGTLIDRLRLGSLWIVGAISGFVLIEPAPYEFMIVLSALLFVATGLKLRARPTCRCS